jgi:hypothetical protein
VCFSCIRSSQCSSEVNTRTAISALLRLASRRLFAPQRLLLALELRPLTPCWSWQLGSNLRFESSTVLARDRHAIEHIFDLVPAVAALCQHLRLSVCEANDVCDVTLRRLAIHANTLDKNRAMMNVILHVCAVMPRRASGAFLPSNIHCDVVYKRCSQRSILIHYLSVASSSV